MSYLEGRDDEEGLEDAGAEAGEEARGGGEGAGVRVAESGLKDGVGAHAKRILQSQVRRERS